MKLSFGHRWWKKSENYVIIKWMNENAINEWNIKIYCVYTMKLYKKEKLIETKLFISLKFTISKIHKNFTICVTRQEAGRGPNSYAPQPTSFPNHHTVVGETPHSHSAHYTLANFNLHQPF